MILLLVKLKCIMVIALSIAAFERDVWSGVWISGGSRLATSLPVRLLMGAP